MIRAVRTGKGACALSGHERSMMKINAAGSYRRRQRAERKMNRRRLQTDTSDAPINPDAQQSQTAISLKMPIYSRSNTSVTPENAPR